METIYQILTFVFGGTSVVGTILSIIWWKQTKRLKEAEVKQKEAEAEKIQADADEAEISRLLTQVDHQQKTIENILTLNSNLTERLSKLNATVDKHIDRNRELLRQPCAGLAEILGGKFGFVDQALKLNKCVPDSSAFDRDHAASVFFMTLRIKNLSFS